MVRDYIRTNKQWNFSSLWKNVLDSGTDTQDLKYILALVSADHVGFAYAYSRAREAVLSVTSH